jgi:hypothetical protein
MSDKKFSADFVMNITRKHVMSSIQRSIDKTMTRLSDGTVNSTNGEEVFFTLTRLQGLKQIVLGYINDTEPTKRGDQDVGN